MSCKNVTRCCIKNNLTLSMQTNYKLVWKFTNPYNIKKKKKRINGGPSQANKAHLWAVLHHGNSVDSYLLQISLNKRSDT